MSQQLTRIRTLISNIDEIQRQGQQKAQLHPVGLTVLPPIATAAVAALPGRIALSLKSNVIVELQIEDASDRIAEVVEIKKNAHGLEFLFSDGKAFHIPFKDVA